MNFDVLKDPSHKFAVVLFVQEDEIEQRRSELEVLGKQRNVHLVVQPCPYEGIEFLYRVAHQLVGHETSMDREIFWQALRLVETTPEKVLKEVAEVYHLYVCAILEQNAKQVASRAQKLESYLSYFAS